MQDEIHMMMKEWEFKRKEELGCESKHSATLIRVDSSALGANRENAAG
jgi:hypothetical protein